MPLKTLQNEEFPAGDPGLIIQCWREGMLRVMLRTLIIWALLAIVPNTLIAIAVGRSDWIVQIALFLALLLFITLSKRTTYRLRVSLLLGMGASGAILYLLQSGLIGTGRIYLFGLVIAGALLLDWRYALLLWIGCVIVQGIIVGAFITGTIRLPPETLIRITDPATLLCTWLIQTGISGMISMAVFIGGVGLKQSLQQAHTTHSLLQRFTAELELRVAERTADLLRTNQDLQAEIAERRTAEAALRASEAKYRLLVEHAGVAIAAYDYDGRILVMNHTAAQMMGGTPDRFVGKSLYDILAPHHADDHLAHIRHVINTGTEQREECIQRPDGIHWYWTTICPIPNADDTLPAVQVIVHDITERKQIEIQLKDANKHLHEQAIRDSLTGVYNRRFLDDILPRELQRADRHRQPVGLIMLDIDYFKQYNDTYGHDVGDMLLGAMGTFLQTRVRGEDTVCRYGGEEFMLVLPGAGLTDVRQRAEEIRTGVERLVIRHQTLSLGTVTVSMGVAVFPDHGTTVDTLSKAADTALYQAKHTGRNRVVVAELADVKSDVYP